GVEGGIGYAYEYAGSAVRTLGMEARMTLCNMSIEGGARAGYVSPDETTFEYVRGRPFAPAGGDWDRALAFWRSIASGGDASFDDEVELDASEIEPMVTWGTNPGQGIRVSERMPWLSELPNERREGARAAYAHMGFSEGEPIAGKKISVAFIGSCTNGRISDLREAAAVAKGRRVAAGVRALVVRCSMCLAMNPDKLEGNQLCASSSNRNFIGRQGSALGRTLLMSPAMVAAAAVSGEVVDSRSF